MQLVSQIIRLSRTGMRIICLAALLMVTAFLPGLGSEPLPARAQSPALPAQSFSQDRLFNVIGRINAENGAPYEHSSVQFHLGHVVQVYSEETWSPRAGIAAYDLADPTAPRLVAATEQDTQRLSEQHAIAFTNAYGGHHVALLATDGIEIWDWTNINDMHQVGRIELPGIAPGYGHGAWWLSWQAPYLYVSGASNGIFIVDTSDPANPVLADRGGQPNPLPNSQTGGFRVGPIFAVGNLLVASANDGRGYATLDIGDPLHPVLLDSLVHDGPPSYSTMVNGDRIFAAGTDDDFHGFDISNPHSIRRLDSVPMEGKGGYLAIQDGYAHVGASRHYVKIDISDDSNYTVVATASSNLPKHDEDFPIPLGNLIVLGDDHYNGSFIFPHQPDPDRAGPVVNMVIPSDGSVGQHRTSRIGLTFSDLIDLRTVDETTVVVRPVGGDAIPGSYSYQTGMVNFTPDQLLEADTIYEVLAPAGGLRDVSGNPIVRGFRSSFTTGQSAGASLLCEIALPPRAEIGQALALDTRVVAGEGEFSYTWEFGDDSPLVSSGASPVNSHVYESPGHYTVRTLVSADSSETSCAALVSIHRPVLAGSAPAASSITLDRSGTQVWNVNPDNDTVTVINAVSLQKMRETPVGRNPTTLAQAGDSSVWVVNGDDASISVVDQESGILAASIPLPHSSQPYAIVFAPDGRTAYVTLEATGQLARIDAQSREMTGLVDVGPSPRGLALSHGGNRIFVTRYISPAHHGEVIELDAATFEVVRTIVLANDPGPDTESSSRGVPNALQAAAVSPDGRSLWIPSLKQNTSRGLITDGQPHTFESTVRAIASRVDLATGQEDLSRRHDFNNREGPVAVGYSPDGGLMFVALRGSNAIDVLNAYSGELVTSLENVGRGPQGMAFTSDGTKLFVHAWLSRSVLVYDIRNIINHSTNRAKLLATIPTVANETLDPQLLAGKRIFYNAADPRMSRDSYLACASCHLDGTHDGRVWDKTASGEGLRNTISLEGHGGMAQGLVHWSGNFDEIQDFEHDIRNDNGGFGFLSDEQFSAGGRNIPLGAPKAGISPDLDALAAYISSLTDTAGSPYRNPDGSLTPEAASGRTLFQRLDCISCHRGPDYTDSGSGQRHDVGTLSDSSGSRLGEPLLGLDTPTLRGLWSTAPYLHDGSALSLHDVFRVGEDGRRHAYGAETEELSAAELDSLVAYLLQIDDREAAAPLSPPHIRIVHPVGGQVLPAGAPIRIGVDAAPAMGTVSRVEFYAGNQLLGADDVPLYRWEWMDPVEGSYEISARLVYANGLSTLSSPVAITVVP